MLIAVCDDEALHRERTAALLRRELWERTVDIDCFDSAQSLLRSVSLGDYAPDIAVLDIQMDGMDGISLAKRLNELAPGCRVIFLTSFLSFATDVYSAEHVYFIVKDELEKRLGDALRRAVASMPAASARPAVLRVPTKQSTELLPLSRVLYLERTGRKTRIVTLDGERLVSAAPGELLSGDLGAAFIRCHQSYWVSFPKIATMNGDGFVLTDGSLVPISRSYRQRTRSRFFELLG